MWREYLWKRVTGIVLAAILFTGSGATPVVKTAYASDINTDEMSLEEKVGNETEIVIDTDLKSSSETVYEVMIVNSEHVKAVFVGEEDTSKEFQVGDKVELQTTPEKSYSVRSITLMDAESGETLSDVQGENNRFSFEMPEASIYVILNVTKTEGNAEIRYVGAPGNVETDIEEKDSKETVTAAVEPGDGCRMEWIAIYDAETGAEICVEETESGYTFELPESGGVTIDVAFVYETEMLSTMTEFKYLEYSTACTYNAGNYVGDRFGITNAQVMAWLDLHRSDNYYLGTAYNISHRNGGSDNRQPNGDPGGDSSDGYGYDDYKGVASLNCTGFVWHAIWRTCTQVWGCDYTTAYNGIPAWGGIGAGGWSTFLRNNNYEYRTYFTKYGAVDAWSVIAMWEDIEKDGYIQPGDVIWCWDANAGSPYVGYYNGDGYAINVGDGLSTASSDRHHTGIYIGNGQWWHSIRSSEYNPNLIEATNQISGIFPVTKCSAITVVKMSQGSPDGDGDNTEENRDNADGDHEITKYHTDTGKYSVGIERLINGQWYLQDEQSGEYIKGFVYLENGKKWVYYGIYGQMLYGEQNIDGHWYLFDPYTGAMTYGFAYIADGQGGYKWVYYNEYGQMLYGEQFVNNHWYYFNEWTGAVTYGFVYHQNGKKWVFYDRVWGWMLYGEQNIDGRWYLFDEWTGATTYGFAYIQKDNKTVFYDRVWGWMLYGWQYIDGRWYYLTPGTGALVG